jgi:ferredoxin--NADP+ reductase
VDELRSTDIADHALEALETSGVKDIYMLGRRGAAQAKFTTKELRELGELLNADIVVKPEEIWLDAASEAATQGQPALQKNIEVLQGFAAKPQEGKPRRVHLRFLVSPVEVLGSERVEGLRIERNRLDQNQNAVGTGMFETLPVQMVLRSVGYKGLPLADVPFDGRKGIIPNEEGRVLEGNQVVGGEYVAGWIKRGPSGVIGTNKADAGETVKLLLADVVGLPDVAAPAPESIDGLLASKGVRVVTVKDWLALDRHEQEAGKAQGRPRVKVVSKEKMLERIEG